METQIVDKPLLSTALDERKATRARKVDKMKETEYVEIDSGSSDDDDGPQKGNTSKMTYMRLLRQNRPFRLYLLSYVANHLGEWLTYLSSLSAIEAIHLAEGREKAGQTAVSLLIAIRLSPNVLLSPFGGFLADQFDRRISMIILDFLGALCALLFIFAVEYRSIPMIYLATFLQECVAGIYEPSRTAIIPLLTTSEEELQKATTLAGMAWSVVAAVGSAAGGLLVTLVGIRGCYSELHNLSERSTSFYLIR
jgi:MFS family permease